MLFDTDFCFAKVGRPNSGSNVRNNMLQTKYYIDWSIYKHKPVVAASSQKVYILALFNL